MDITKVKEAQETIREEERELEQIVKEYLETTETIRPIFFCNDSELDNFTIDFQKNGLSIMLCFRYSAEDVNYDYLITCKEYGIYDYEPPTSNKCTAQGNLLAEYNVEVEGKIMKACRIIFLKQYLE